MQVFGRNITVGADPEIFVQRNGKPFSAFGLIPGDKANPHKVDKGAVQVDGMALEFNIDPAEDRDQFIANLDAVQRQLKSMIGDYELSEDCTAFFDREHYIEQPPEARILGCEADYNAYTRRRNPSPEGKPFMRTAGGHIHLGGWFPENYQTPRYFKFCQRVAKAMDEFVGVYSILWDSDDNRRSMYGKASCFRPKPYGMEYRTMSNAWLFNKDVTKWVYDQTIKAAEAAMDRNYEPNTDVVDIINNSDRTNTFFSNNAKADEVKSFTRILEAA